MYHLLDVNWDPWDLWDQLAWAQSILQDNLAQIKASNKDTLETRSMDLKLLYLHMDHIKAASQDLQRWDHQVNMAANHKLTLPLRRPSGVGPQQDQGQGAPWNPTMGQPQAVPLLQPPPQQVPQ